MKIRVISRFGMNTLVNEKGKSIASVTSKLKADELAYRWNEYTALKTECAAYKNALWKACGDDEEIVDSYLESVGFKKESGK